MLHSTTQAVAITPYPLRDGSSQGVIPGSEQPGYYHSVPMGPKPALPRIPFFRFLRLFAEILSFAFASLREIFLSS
jgi:hypothetical protein